MRNAQQIAEFIEKRIGHIYGRPLMYGGTAEGVDLLLHSYHELWAVIHQRNDDYQQALFDLYAEEGCGSANFSFHHHRQNPEAQHDETVRYVVEQWKRISRTMGLPIDKIE